MVDEGVDMDGDGMGDLVLAILSFQAKKVPPNPVSQPPRLSAVAADEAAIPPLATVATRPAALAGVANAAGSAANTVAVKARPGALRPKAIDDFMGQPKIVDNLFVFIEAAKQRTEALDHVLLHGPPGLGKTTLSYIIANEMNVNIKITSGPVMEKPGDRRMVMQGMVDWFCYWLKDERDPEVGKAAEYARWDRLRAAR